MKDLLITLLNTAFWFGLHFGTAGVICALPQTFQRRVFRPERRFFRVSPREMRFYRAIHLPRWKDRLPQFNPDFNKRHLTGRTPAYLDRFLFITCRAEIIHYAIGILGWLSLFFCRLSDRPAVWLPRYAAIALGIQLCNLPFSFIQRYNRARLLRVREKSETNAGKHGLPPRNLL